MVRPEGKPARGPLTKTAVLHWLAKGKIGADDRIGSTGGETLPITDHPEFRGCFIPGSVDEIRLQELKKQHENSHRRATVGRMVQRMTVVLLVLLSGGFIWVGLNTRVFVLGSDTLSLLEASIDVVQDYIDPPPASETALSASNIPHADWAAAQQDEGVDSELDLHRARMGIWTAELRELDQVRRTMLRAMGRAPMDPMPLVGLIEVDSQLLATHPELLGEIVRANSRLEALNGAGAVVDRARGAFALAKGDKAGARQLTEGCSAKDIGCSLIFSEASEDLGKLMDIRSQVGPSPRVLRAIGRASLAKNDWASLKSVTDEMVAVMPNEATGYVLRSEHLAAMGDWNGAQYAAEKAFSLDSDTLASAHLRASYLFEIEGDNVLSSALFNGLLEHHLIDGYSGKATLRVQAIMSTLKANDPSGARRIANAALEADPDHPGTQLANAFVLRAEGETVEVETVLRAISTSGLEEKEAALVHLWIARLFIDLDKQRLARGELDDAERHTPNSRPIAEETLWALLNSRDISGAISLVQTLPLMHSGISGHADPRHGIGLGSPPVRRVAENLLAAMDEDIRYEKDRDAVAAVLGWLYRPSGDAVLFLQEVAERDAGRLAVQASLARAYHQAGNWPAAHEYAQNVVSRQPSNPLFQYLRGYALSKLNRWDDAEDALNRAIRLSSDNAQLLHLTAMCFLENGHNAKAAELLAQALKIDDGDTSVRRSMLALDSRNE